MPTPRLLLGPTLLCLTAALIGCASSSEVRLPGSEARYQVRCSGSSWEGCYDRAEQLCPAEGYQVLSRYEDYSRRSIPRNLIIRCGPPPAEESSEEIAQTSPVPPQQNDCCADLATLSQKCSSEIAGDRLVMLSDPLEIALIEGVRSALPRSELEALVRMLKQ